MRVFCPAKLNLFLHVTGEKENGYHELQSLVCFADFGDFLEIQTSDTYNLTINGPFADQCGSTDNNLITKAINAVQEFTDQKLSFDIKLEKNIPVGAGLGGGSGNAAAITHLLLDHAGITLSDDDLNGLLLSLGTDIPVCYKGQTAFTEGVGEKITPLSISGEISLLLVFPNIPVSTRSVFSKMNAPYSEAMTIEKEISNDIISLIKRTRNDLTSSAIEEEPLIENVLNALSSHSDCLVSRMTGSGACCFGFFENQDSAQKAEKFFHGQYKNWWSKAVNVTF